MTAVQTMTAPQLADVVAAIQNLSTPAAQQTTNLKLAKNELVGHTHKKAEFVQLGGLDALDVLLAACVKSRGKRSGRDGDANGAASVASEGVSTNITNPGGIATGSVGVPGDTSTANELTEEDSVCYQALVLVGSLAHGGPAYIEPIKATSLLTSVCVCIAPSSDPPQITLAALRALAAFSQAEQLQTQHEESGALCDATTITALAEVLAQESASAAVLNQVTLACTLLKHQIVTTSQKTHCVRSGIVDYLASRLAAYHVKHNPRIFQRLTSLPTLLPAPTLKSLPQVLAALTRVVAGSRYRIARLLHSTSLSAFLPFCPLDITPDAIFTDPRVFNALPQFMIPVIHPGQQKENNFSKAFPALSSIQPSTSKGSSFAEVTDISQFAPEKSVPNLESSVIPWLVQLMRTDQQATRIEAARLLVAIYKAGWVSRNRERMFALLVVPLLVGQLSQTSFAPSLKPDAATTRAVEALANVQDEPRQRIPEILGELITDNKALAKAAVDAKIIKWACVLFKKTFEPITTQPAEWSQHDPSEASMEALPTRRLGSTGVPVQAWRVFRDRESILHLLCALALDEDKYRKELCENQVVQLLIESMAPLNVAALRQLKDGDKVDVHIGNPKPVLQVACHLTRMISRSVSILRTSLIDGGIAKPMMKLLNSEDEDVAISATDAISNLLLEFSPMRQEFIEDGTIKLLCEHAHSSNLKLRHSSLWALKSLCHTAPNNIKLQIFDRLSPAWLDQVLSSPSGGSTPGVPFGKTSPSIGAGANAAGERVDILNAVDEPMDTSEPAEESSARLNTSNSSTVVDAMFATLSTDYQTWLRQVQQLEDEEKARSASQIYTDIHVQALDFLRNFINGPGNNETLDAFFNAFGTAHALDLIAAKLRTDTADVAVIKSAVFVIVHIAAGAPRHRALLFSNSGLLRLLLPLLSHPEGKLRQPTLWVINNLTWTDDHADVDSARTRATVLCDLGFLDKCREIKTSDPCVDVRERALTAVGQLELGLSASAPPGGPGAS